MSACKCARAHRCVCFTSFPCPADAPGDIEDVVEAKQRALLDEEFVALVCRVYLSQRSPLQGGIGDPASQHVFLEPAAHIWALGPAGGPTEIRLAPAQLSRVLPKKPVNNYKITVVFLGAFGVIFEILAVKRQLKRHQQTPPSRF